jgi:hypothetical protein
LELGPVLARLGGFLVTASADGFGADTPAAQLDQQGIGLPQRVVDASQASHAAGAGVIQPSSPSKSSAAKPG